MKGDFTRFTHDPLKHYTRVLMQQGRVQLDADWNELNAILLHYLRSLARDLIGPHGGVADSFKIVPLLQTGTANPAPFDFLIQPGYYYVDGILCESRGCRYTDQPDFKVHAEDDKLHPSARYHVVLDVWERHITFIQDERIRETALGEADTATRSQIVWQVRVEQVLPAGPPSAPTGVIVSDTARPVPTATETVTVTVADPTPRLRARVHPEKASTDACVASPESRYRGPENQLYRVEIHYSSQQKGEEGPTFKWSRENGSVVFPILSLKGSVATVASLGRDTRLGLAVGDWVEIVDDEYELEGRAVPLLEVDKIDPVSLEVTLKGELRGGFGLDQARHPLLRRWDQKIGAKPGGLKVVEGQGEDDWLPLEDGIEIQFEKGSRLVPKQYRTGAYWLIPARTATQNIEWPVVGRVPQLVGPHGIEHHTAPLADIALDQNGILTEIKDRRFVIHPCAVPAPGAVGLSCK